VLDFFQLGSTLSMRSYARFGSEVSLFGISKFGSSISVFDFFHLGSALSMRSLARMGSSFSLFGVSRLGSSVSVLDFSSLGSSLSLRNYARMGESMSVFGFVHLGSSLSVLDFVHLGSTLSVRSIKATTVSDGVGTTYAKFTTSQIELYADSSRGLTVDANGGTLHGAWSSDATVTTSDRRLKKNIEPLYRTLAEQARKRFGQATEGEASPDGTVTAAATAALGTTRQKEAAQAPVGWLLRELRPVSFQLKRGPEAKYLKFGFIAQELETVFPNLVRTSAKDDTKAVASQDLIAVLTLAMQQLQKENEEHRKALAEQQARIARLERAVYGNTMPFVQV
jgi:hypothetical protein